MFSFQSLVLATLWLACCAHSSTQAHTKNAAFEAALDCADNQWSTNTVISRANTATFYNATERWDIYAPPSYQMAISPATEADVVKAVSVKSTIQIHIQYQAWHTDGRDLHLGQPGEKIRRALLGHRWSPRVLYHPG